MKYSLEERVLAEHMTHACLKLVQPHHSRSARHTR
jgi:hypothetical protein